MSTTVTATARLRRPAAFVVTLAVCAIAIPASASGFYGSAPEQGSGPATAPNDSGPSNDSGPPVPDHTSLNALLGPVSGSSSPSGVEQPTPTPVIEPSPIGDGFDWADAALGAGVAIALIALGTVAAFTLRRRGAHGTVSPAG
jgi:hypothetical protein